MADIGSLLESAATLMVTGMLAVFLFLTILVFLVTIMAKLVPKEISESSTQANTHEPSPLKSRSLDPKIIAAITSAIHQYRNRDRQ
ncbi:oxaloacetate decarboxylase subunit gamma [Vibrio sp. S4M6]|uniref:oxaloacetate decarboxylase subunit gamma n=1 Tax=Vibrio sinus TaxID=2946865 RepID=UPI002029D85B|nr:oxaloacetate decarboxylase subunit gamma [Vibrio sinus]MCL9781002.1 oxaloacetate decarboxylase subunit gamma [Vibrio sinus]